MQLAFMEIHLPKDVRRKAEKLMSRYKVLEAIIESRKLDLEPRLITNYQASESQRGNQFHSETENLALAEMEIGDYVRTRRKLYLVYQSLKPIQQMIWEQRYILGRNDVDVYNGLNIDDRTYYILKKEMIAVVAEAFCLQNNAVKLQ